MTPQRLKYLIKISTRERHVRTLISNQKYKIARLKSILNYNENDEELRLRCLALISEYKFILSAFRHALARLKGMDRVVVPKISYSFDDDFPTPIFECSCGMILCGTSYCERCGRRILWENHHGDK